MSKQTYELCPVMQVKLGNRPFEYQVLKAIFEGLAEFGKLKAFPEHPSNWGFVPRVTIARALGFPRLTKSLSRRIRRAFLWLEKLGYLGHHDVNVPGKKWGATRFILALFVYRVVQKAVAVLGPVFSKDSKASSRTPRLAPAGWRPPEWMSKRSALAAGFAG